MTKDELDALPITEKVVKRVSVNFKYYKAKLGGIQSGYFYDTLKKIYENSI